MKNPNEPTQGSKNLNKNKVPLDPATKKGVDQDRKDTKYLKNETSDEPTKRDDYEGKDPANPYHEVESRH